MPSNEELRLMAGLLKNIVEHKRCNDTEFGDETVTMLYRLERKLHYAPYCIAHGIRYEDMTEDDYVDAYLEMN